MYRKRILRLCGLALWMSSASVALGQNYSSNNQYGGGSSQGGGGTQASFLNQMALRSAQQLLANSLQQTSAPSSAARIGLGLGTSFSGTKPFTSYSAPPTVSPYLNLFRTDSNGQQNAFNYSTLVQPQLQQQQINQQLQRQQMQDSRRLQSIAAQPQLNPQGSKELFPTGHQTVFMHFSHYYSGTGPRAKRQRQ